MQSKLATNVPKWLKSHQHIILTMSNLGYAKSEPKTHSQRLALRTSLKSVKVV